MREMLRGRVAEVMGVMRGLAEVLGEEGSSASASASASTSTSTSTSEAAPAAIAALQVPAEVMGFRPLLRFLHEEVPEGVRVFVQNSLDSVVLGDKAEYRVLDLHRELRPYLPKGHPIKKELRRLGGMLRQPGLAGRRFALHCLVAARLPGWRRRLAELARADLPGGLGELARFYLDLSGP